MTDFATRRTVMVDTQVRPNDVTSFPIIEAMLHVPRERFVPESRREAAYLGENLRLGAGRVLLEPRSFAKLLEAVAPLPGERALHVGAGLGYGAAVLARLGLAVTALEEDPAMADAARAALAAEGVAARVAEGPLAQGAPDGAPFDVVLVEGAVEAVPEALLGQLAEGGRLAALVAEGAVGTARLWRREGGALSARDVFNAGAPVLPGFDRPRAFVL